MTAISVVNLHKTFNTKVLDNVSFDIQEGDFTALIGPSGSGKSTLMRHLSGLIKSDKNNDSKIIINGQAIQEGGKISAGINKKRQEIGCIFQQFNLVNRLSVLQNVLIGFLGKIPNWRGYVGYFTKEEKIRALQALDRVGLAHLASQKASDLSGGQQQRVAIARALVQDAKVILADEPIASLDPKSARQVMDMLKAINEEDGKTVIVTLHQVGVARKYCKNMIALRDGKLYFEGLKEDLTDEKLMQLYGGDVSEMLDDEGYAQAAPTKDAYSKTETENNQTQNNQTQKNESLTMKLLHEAQQQNQTKLNSTNTNKINNHTSDV